MVKSMVSPWVVCAFHFFGGMSENAGVAMEMDKPRVPNNDKMKIQSEYLMGYH